MAQLVKDPPANAGDLDSIPGWGRSAGEGKGYALQYSGLENAMDCLWVAKSQTCLRDFHFAFNILCVQLNLRNIYHQKKLKQARDFPGGLVVKTPRSQCGGPG